ncbi:MAG: hypothetical protein ACOVSR_08945 [Bacteroidia bacterium]
MKIDLKFYFSDCTLDSESYNYHIRLNDNTFDYCFIAVIKFNESGKIENRYELTSINKRFISSIDIYEIGEGENYFIVKLNISGRENDIIIPFKDCQDAYGVYLQIKKWNNLQYKI